MMLKQQAHATAPRPHADGRDICGCPPGDGGNLSSENKVTLLLLLQLLHAPLHDHRAAIPHVPIKKAHYGWRAAAADDGEGAAAVALWAAGRD
jgi:hypothetical protein